jgi:hypothetical protein
VTAEYVPPGLALPEKITGFRPNILHFFCHGGVDASSSLLEIATRSSGIASAASSPQRSLL